MIQVEINDMHAQHNCTEERPLCQEGQQLYDTYLAKQRVADEKEWEWGPENSDEERLIQIKSYKDYKKHVMVCHYNAQSRGYTCLCKGCIKEKVLKSGITSDEQALALHQKIWRRFVAGESTYEDVLVRQYVFFYLEANGLTITLDEHGSWILIGLFD